MKAYTDIEQSKKLAEILPIESSDMHYSKHPLENYYSPMPLIGKCSKIQNDIPCWSFAALFEVLPKFIGDYGKCIYYDIGGYYCGYMVDGDFMLTIEETRANNPVDACVEMIVILYKKGLL